MLWGDDTFFNGRSLGCIHHGLAPYFRTDTHVQIVTGLGIGYKALV